MLGFTLKEDFLYYLWQTKNFDTSQLTTQRNEKLKIISWGNKNYDSGPDFTQVKLQIDDILWAGNIEMHIYSSDWTKHKHQHDDAYKNVILHVVYKHDEEIYTSEGLSLPVLELKDRISPCVMKNYLSLMNHDSGIPCERLLEKVNLEKFRIWQERLIIQRLERKTNELNKLYQELNSDWDEMCYRLVFKYLGGKVNAEACLHLASVMPLKIIQKNLTNRDIVEALLFGQAGFLQANYTDDYFDKLKREYAYQKTKYGLVPMNPVQWKFSRMMPAGFPSLRIAQMAGLLYCKNSFLQYFLEHEELEDYYRFFETDTNEYWRNHFNFGHQSSRVSAAPGKDIIHIILINAICPILFFYGMQTCDENYKEKAIRLLEQIPAENNKITRKFKSLGIDSNKSIDSQALIELKTNYCDKKNCLQCAIGLELLRG